jgi:hypothetical protein
MSGTYSIEDLISNDPSPVRVRKADAHSCDGAKAQSSLAENKYSTGQSTHAALILLLFAGGWPSLFTKRICFSGGNCCCCGGEVATPLAAELILMPAFPLGAIDGRYRGRILLGARIA